MDSASWRSVCIKCFYIKVNKYTFRSSPLLALPRWWHHEVKTTTFICIAPENITRSQATENIDKPADHLTFEGRGAGESGRFWERKLPANFTLKKIIMQHEWPWKNARTALKHCLHHWPMRKRILAEPILPPPSPQRSNGTLLKLFKLRSISRFLHTEISKFLGFQLQLSSVSRFRCLFLYASSCFILILNRQDDSEMSRLEYHREPSPPLHPTSKWSF